VDYSQLDDLVLVSLVARRNEAALSALYDRYSRLVFSLALRIVGERTLAEEITSDAFISVWRAAVTFAEERGRFVPWLMSITRHRAIDELRRLKVRPEGNAVDLNEAYNAEQSDQVDGWLAWRQRALVRSALATLPLRSVRRWIGLLRRVDAAGNCRQDRPAPRDDQDADG
jgi:RNA polymerase sigma-70 factor (ECF subfamily)